MGLRRRSLSALAAMCAIVLCTGIVGTVAVARGFDRAERETLEEHVGSAETLLERSAEATAALARDYGFWTDSLEFVTGKYPKYPEQQLGDAADTLTSLGLEALAYADEDEIFYGAYIVDDTRVDLPDDFAAWARNADIPELGTSETAVTNVDGQPAIVAIVGITDNDATVEPPAALIMARVIDEALLRELSDASPATLAIGAADAATGLRFVGADAAIGNVALRDLDGSRTATLHVRLDRPVASAARASLQTLVLALVGGVALAIGGFGYWLTFYVTRRIALLDGQVEQLRHGGEGTLSVTGDDEIARLSDNAQALLDEVAALQHRRAEAKLGTMIQHSSDIVLMCDAAGIVRYATPALQRTLGVDPARVGDRPAAEVLGVDEPIGFSANLGRLAATSPGQTLTFACDVHTGDGDVRHLEVVGMNHLETAAVEAFVLTVRDQTDRRRFEEDLRRQAVTDELTGLGNRTLFHDRVGHALARQQRHAMGGVAVLFLDLDDFKMINDGLGHSAGDAVLCHVAQVLSSCLRPSDTAARLGGDEFACLLEGVHGPADALAVIERIQAGLADPIVLDDRTVRVTASVGVAFADTADLDADALLRNADTAMYVAKGDGKARSAVFSYDMHTDATRNLDLRNALADALERDEFRLVYQPIVDLQTGRGVGAEALLRWRHPTRGEIGPIEFIPIAESTGIIVPLGRWVLEQACQHAVTWQRTETRPNYVSVNVSARQLTDERIVDDVANAIATSGLPPHLLQIELTESLFISDRAAVAATLKELKELGVTLAVDDFGTGHASLSYLRDFPIDVLKIDRSFIQAINDGDSHEEFLDGVLTLAHSLRLRTLAEGIEHDYERDHLRTAACQLAQGFLFARPMEHEDFYGWLSSDTDSYAVDGLQPG